MKKVYLILENGCVFEGQGFGAEGEVIGEVVFTTAMTGYLETLTDPSYFGQMVVQTFPLIGNYGVIPEDFESRKVYLSAYIVRDVCDAPSNFRNQGTLDAFLKEQNIVGISGIDTRQLTKIVRESGVMNGIITQNPELTEEMKKRIHDFVIRKAVASTSCEEKEIVEAVGEKKKTVVLMDYGLKRNIARELAKRGCEVIIMPHDTKAEDVIKLNPDGIMLSNGPGDPKENVFEIEQINKMFHSGIPMFGICLGHQLTAISQGANTYKLKYGHRGANQPVKNVETGRVYVTTQNHGYAVDGDTLPKTAKVSYVNVNDGTCEGVNYSDENVFTVQFHPEACGGPLDTRFLFDEFIKRMEARK